MEQRLSLVTLGVADLAQALRFYEALGWHRNNNDENVVFFQLPGMILGLWSRTALAEDAGVADDGKPGFSGVSLAYNCRTRDEVDAVLLEAQAAGATLLKPGAEAFWGGYTGYFSDPDGHVWEVAWNPGFPIAADGSISLSPPKS